jgi:hypothetical protein
MRIFKYPLRVDDRQTVQLPKGAELLTVQTQHGSPCLWALVDEAAETESRVILMHGTGHPISCLGKYLGTFQLDGGNLVFHAFTGV